MVELLLLGPVELAVCGRPVEVGPPQRCTVLAALAVDAGRPVTVETLIDRVWGDTPPDRVRRALHAHITRIRRLLEHAVDTDGRPVSLLRRPGGYLIDIDPARVDLHRFRRLLDRARERTADDDGRVELLRAALDLWRGEPLAGLAGRWAVRTRQGWCQERLDGTLAWARAELAVGNAGAVIGPLSDLLGVHPLLEPLAEIQIRALYAVGRTADALGLYQTVRKRLVDDLGTEPGADLQRTHQAVLRDDLPRTAPALSIPPAPKPARLVPAQLPRDVRGFSGRRAELAELDTLLTGAGDPHAPAVVGAVAGTAGVGKTALAVHWAHRVGDRFPDGQVYVNLRGFDPSGQVMDPAEAVRRFLDALSVPPQRIPADLDAQAALYRSEMAGRRVLVVLDNARDTAQVRPLLPGSPGCLVLVTSRNQLTGLIATDGAHPVALNLLTHDEARQLLSLRLGAARVAAEPDAVREIVARCACLPLALALVAGRAAVRPGVPLATLAEELRDAQKRWEALTGDDPISNLRAVFSWSYRALARPAAELFRLLGLHPGPDISVPAAASLAGIAPATARSLLAELARASLLVEHVPGRYTFHDLLRGYAAGLARETDTGSRCDAAVGRMLDHYLHTAYAAAMLLYPGRDPVRLEPHRAGVTPEELADHDQALAWFTVEHPVLLAAVDLAADAGLDTHTWQLAWTVANFFDRRGHWHDYAATQRAAVAAAGRLDEPATQALAYRLLARAHTRLGRFDDALADNGHALDLYARCGDDLGRAHTHLHTGMMWDLQGRHLEALEHARKALGLYRALGRADGHAQALNAVGWLHAQLGEHEQALASCEQSLALLEETGDRYGQAATWDSIGFAHHNLGNHAEATVSYGRSLDLSREFGDRYLEARVLVHLGDSRAAAGDPDAARAEWRRALAILDELGHPEAVDVRAKLGPPG